MEFVFEIERTNIEKITVEASDLHEAMAKLVESVLIPAKDDEVNVYYDKTSRLGGCDEWNGVWLDTDLIDLIEATPF